jgi:hypothetical protein
VGEIVLSHLKASAFFRLSTLGVHGLRGQCQVSQWDTFVAPSVDARPRFNAVEQHLTFDGSQYLERRPTPEVRPSLREVASLLSYTHTHPQPRSSRADDRTV